MLALNTERVQLGPSVSHPYVRHPVVLASNAATLDEISHGRAILGLGRGSFYYAIRLDTPAPLTALSEAIDVVRHFLSGERSEYAGRVFQVAPGASLMYQPPRDRMTIFLGAIGRRACRLAGEKADGVFGAGVWHPDYVRLMKEEVEAGARAAGRDPAAIKVGPHAWTSLSLDRETARARARRQLSLYLPHIEPLTTFFAVPRAEVETVTAAQRRGDLAAAAAAVSERSIDLLMAAGTPGDLVARARELIDAGASHITFDVAYEDGAEETIQLLGERVLPELGVTL